MIFYCRNTRLLQASGNTTCGVLDVIDREYRAAVSGKMPLSSRISVQFALLLWMVLHTRGLHSEHSSDRGVEADVFVGHYKIKIGEPRDTGIQITQLKGSANRRLAAVPGPPTDVYGLQSPSEQGIVWVTWTPPADHNSTITTFEVTTQHTRMDIAPLVDAVNTTGNSVSIANLTIGVGYTFKVRAINSAGSGGYSEESEVVVLSPGRITNATVSLSTNKAGESGSMHLSFTCQHDFPRRGYILLEVPDSTFTIRPNAAVVASGNSNSFIIATSINDNEGSMVRAGEQVSITISNVTNPVFEGDTGPFTIKTLGGDKRTTIDEASADYNSDNRPGGVVITPGRFRDPPTVVLSTYLAGGVGAATVSFIPANPIPLNGHIFVEFPRNFSSTICTAAIASGLDGGLLVSMVQDGHAVDIQRDGTGTIAESGANVSVELVGGIVNQHFEGLSDVFPMVKTTLSDSSVSIDEASMTYNIADRPASVRFTPGTFVSPAVVSLESYVAGTEGGGNITFSISNPLPSDGHIIVEFPRAFGQVSSSSKLTASGIDGGFSFSLDGFTIDINRDGTGTATPAGSSIRLTFLDGIVNQMFEGPSGVFPMIKTTLRDINVSVDEMSVNINSEGRPLGVLFTPGAFPSRPKVALHSYEAGAQGSVNISFTTSNWWPSDGHVVVQFPSNFPKVFPNAVVPFCGVNGGLTPVNATENERMVFIRRDGDGTDVSPGTEVSIKLVNGVTNQNFEGWSEVFPMFKTTLADTNVSIDEASLGFSSATRPLGVLFTPAAFARSPTVALSSYAAGVVGGANISFTISNPLPLDGRVIVMFPSNFTSVNSRKALASGLDGGLVVHAGADGYRVDVERDGTGSVAEAGTEVTLMLLDGIVNPPFEGLSDPFPVVKTTLRHPNVSIDEAKDIPAGISFTPGAFAEAPSVTLDSYLAGASGGASITFSVTNPVPSDGRVVIEFPKTFSSISCTTATAEGIDGGFRVTMESDGFTVHVQRDGTGSNLPEGSNVSIYLEDGIMNQQFQGMSGVFPVIKTTLTNGQISIDETSADFNSHDRPAGVRIIPGRFDIAPVIDLARYDAGAETSVNLSLTVSNPLPPDGHVIIEFPSAFTMVSFSAFTMVLPGVDGSFFVSLGGNGRTVYLQRDGTGTQVDSGKQLSFQLVDGVVNQNFEGMSGVFPVIKTTLQDTSISIDEVSSVYNSGDQPAVSFEPGAFADPPMVLLENYAAGAKGGANISFTTSNPLPPDAHMIIMFPNNFMSITCTHEQVIVEGIDGGLAHPIIADDGLTVYIQRDGTGSVVEAGVRISIRLLDGVENQNFEGMSDIFPMVKTTLVDIDVSIDEASLEINSGDLPKALRFIPGAFAARPLIRLESYTAGVKGAAEISFVMSNPLPPDGSVIVEFPTKFKSVETNSVIASGMDGGFHVWVGSDGYTVHVERDGTGTTARPRERVILSFPDGIENQEFEGLSGPFPVVKTTLADMDVSIDETSLDHHWDGRPEPVWFIPGMFSEPPRVALESYAAGYSGGATVSFGTSNPIPSDGHIIIQFPNNFTSVNCTAVTAVGMDGGFSVSVYSGVGGYSVDVERDGTGTEVPRGTFVTVTIVHGVENQQFEGRSAVFPEVKTTLADNNVSIDEASAVYYDGDRPPAIWFTPAAFVEPPLVSLDSYMAGVESAANVTFTTRNPIPIDGQVILQFPSDFTSVNCNAATALGMDGGFSVTTAAGSYIVVIERDGTGTEVGAGQTVTVRLVNGIVNQQFEGPGKSMPLVKTTLSDSNVSIDDSRQGPNMSAIFFTAGGFTMAEAFLQYDVAGIRSSIDFSFSIANPIPPEGVLRVEFPDDFVSASPIFAESQELGDVHVSGSYNLTIRRSGSGGWVESATSINLKLSQIINSMAVGSTGSFSISTFLDDSMNNRIDTGIVTGVFIGKHILGASAEFGSSSMAVASQQKRWTFSGHGVAPGDQVKWVNSSAVSDGHCDWGAETVAITADSYSNNRTVASITFQESSEYTGPLKLCYRFSVGDHPFKLYSTITLSVYELYGVSAAAEGSKHMSVVGYPKVLTLSGFGIRELDKTKWLLQGGDNCTSSEDVAALAWGGENVAYMSSSGEISMEFSENVFNMKHFSGNAGAIVTLCYRFGLEEYQRYPAISLTLHHVTGLTTSVGGPSHAVVGVPEHLTFTGYGLSEGSVDRARWTLSRTSCRASFAEVSEAQHDHVLVSGGQATFTFKPSASGETPRLCFWFQDEPAMLYPALEMKVAQLSVLWAPSFGDSDVAVVGYPKTWGFRGGNIGDGDYVRWIYNESTDCLDASSVAKMAEDGEILAGETICTFAPELSGRWITPCYRHSNEPWHRYDMPVYVKMVHTMTAAWGNNSAFVADQPKRWVFDGDGLASTSNTDLVKFIVDATDCTSGLDVPLTGADVDGVAMYTTSDHQAAFNIQPAVAGKSVSLCYKFANEEYMWYDIRAYVHHLQSVESRVGGEDIAVVDVEEVLEVHADGASTKDLIRWVVSDDILLDEDCNRSIRVWDSGPKELMELSVVFNGGEFTTNFTFNSTSAGLSPTLCYRFGEEKWKAYADVTINIAMLQAVRANEGADTVAVVHYAKRWRLLGHFLGAGDQLFWTTRSCETIAAADVVGDSDGILMVDETMASWFEFDTPVSGNRVTICYKFNDEPFKKYGTVKIDVRMIHAVAVDVGSPRKAIPATAKTFSFVGDGTAVEGGIDSVKWIKGHDCSTRGIVGHLGDLIKKTDFDLVYYESTGFTAQTIAFPETEVGGPYTLCYAFDEEPYQVYRDLVMTVLGITDVSAEEGSNDIIVLGALKRLTFTGGGAIEAGDQAIWISGGKTDSDCLKDVFLTGPQSVVDSSLGADFLIPDGHRDAKAGHTWTLCYRFGTESLKIYPEFSLTAVTLDAFPAQVGSNDDIVVGYPKTFFPGGPGVSEGDQAKWVSTSVTADGGCASEDTMEASTVRWTRLISTNGTLDLNNTAGSKLQPTADSSTMTKKKAVLESSFMITVATLGLARVQLCYKHQSEPYHLYADITLRTRQLLSASVRELGIQNALTSIADSPQTVAFVAVGGMGGDRYKWVHTTQDFASVTPSINRSSASESFFEACAEWVEPAAGSSVGVSQGFYEEATFIFSEPSSGLIVCYGPGVEPFVPYPAITMEVIPPVISAGSPSHVLVGRYTTVRLIGTFGLTSGDAMKLAQNADGDCSGDPAGGDGLIFYPDSTSRGLRLESLGSSLITLHVSQRTEENRPYKLCYRFGSAGAWKMFDHVSWEAFEVIGVSLTIGDDYPAAGQLLDFTFLGTGIMNGDQAKWVNTTVSSDGACGDAASVVGSSTAEVFDGIAQFRFNGNVNDWVLCYKHGSNDWRLYSGIIPTTKLMATTPSKIPVSDTQRTKADVSMTIEGTIASYPAGSTARANFLDSFISDLSKALRVPSSRLTVTRMRAGSVVVDFSITSTGSLADASATELLLELVQQMSDASSALFSGNVTSGAKGVAYTTSLEAESKSRDSSTENIGIPVLECQEKGLFGFTTTAWYTTEASGGVRLIIQRLHGTKGFVDIGYSTKDRTATGDIDYKITEGVVRFYDGDASKTIEIPIIDDVETEAHFEVFTVSLSLEGAINQGAALMATAGDATVYLYDYGDGLNLAGITFDAVSFDSNSTRWEIVDNGGVGGWVDSNGFAAKDAVIGSDEYDDRCDYAATAPCDHDCRFGGGLAGPFSTRGEKSLLVLELNGMGYVTTVRPVTDFPSSTLSITFWIRAISPSGGRGGGAVLSYAAPDASPGETELLLHNLNSLTLLVHGNFVPASKRYDGLTGGDLAGIRTGIDLARDGEWHHVGVAWRSSDGRVEAYLDGARVFDGGPYKTSAELPSGGRFVLGQSQSGKCLADVGDIIWNCSTATLRACEVFSGDDGPDGLEAQVQRLRLWSKFITANEVAQQMKDPFQGNSIGQVLYWDFNSMLEGNMVEDQSGIGVSISGVPNHGLVSKHGSSFVHTSPTLSPAYPCGPVHSGIWRFAASDDFVAAIRGSKSYGGRLQFRLAYTSANGDIRSERGAVTIRTDGGEEISWTSIFAVAEALPGRWTHVSVVLREDHGWRSEPLGGAVNATDMQIILKEASEILIRGDIRVYGQGGGGQEVVYLQDVRLLARH